MNLHRSPYGGRHFECFSEDPLLTARIGVAYVRGVQAGGVAATVKQFVANDSETDRFTLDARVDGRALRERYLAPFQPIVREAGVWAVMAAYNSINGVTATEHPMLAKVLKDEWGFDGVVMSDWYAARSTEPAANAGLDLVMPGPGGPWGDRLVAAVRQGRVPEAAIDDKVLRLLRLAARVGALEGVDPAAAPDPWSDDAVAAELRESAAAGFVLVRNAAPALPLDGSALRRVAVLGPNAEAAAVEVHTRLHASESGTYLLGGSGLGTLRLTLDNQVAFDTVTELPTGADPVEALMRPPQPGTTVTSRHRVWTPTATPW